MPAYELTEWAAYEQVVGPLGPPDRLWGAEVQAATVDAIREQTFLHTWINTEEKDRSSLERPEAYPRPRDPDPPEPDEDLDEDDVEDE
ncbi:hypothetical protein ACF07Q_28580 [Nocardiopsis dassonvillei]|uniref:hypothetical protein n=1 Tax=Nocardiopsis dassonvillei TaxID=2014 RepID=UPI0036FABB65